jgi:hypothetical protein
MSSKVFLLAFRFFFLPFEKYLLCYENGFFEKDTKAISDNIRKEQKKTVYDGSTPPYTG